MELKKIPYEISLWEDVPGGTEKKLFVIGSSTMDTPIAAFEPKLTQKTDGTNTLVFSIFAKYYDKETNEFKQNPFIPFLFNERRVKLKYRDNEWLDFVIKKCDESSENYKFTYTATDFAINELSKTGFNLVFDAELKNNQGNIKELAGRVMEGTDWEVESDIIPQLSEEALYSCILPQEAVVFEADTGKVITTIGEGNRVFVFHSTEAAKNYGHFEFLYKSGTDETDLAKLPVNDKWLLQGFTQYYTELSSYPSTEYVPNFRGERKVRTQKIVYDPVMDKYVQSYNGGEVYSYTQTEYVSPSLVTNLITNGDDIIYPTGWRQGTGGTLETVKIGEVKAEGGITYTTFGLNFLPQGNFLLNYGFRDSAELIKEIATGDKFRFKITSPSKAYFEIAIQKYEIVNGEMAIYSGSEVLLLKNYQPGTYAQLEAKKSLSYKELTDFSSGEKYGIFITTTGNFDSTEAKEGIKIEKVELFREIKDKDGKIMHPSGGYLTASKPSTPPVFDGYSTDVAPTAYVDSTYYYYSKPSDEAMRPDQIQYLYIGKEQPSAYTPDYTIGFEKIRNITAKESNRFNLLQTLAETFECWCKISLEHNADGTISSRKIGFKEKIGEEKNVGFTYGVNLKSTSRSLDSNEIATKLIVKNNSNEFGDGGFCSIQRATLNPSGENFLIDFSYYIRQKLLKLEDVYRDLYDTADEHLGTYTNLSPLNLERDELIIEQSGLVANYSKAESKQEAALLQLKATEEELLDQLDYYYDLTSYEYEEAKPENWQWEDDSEAKNIGLEIERLKKKSYDLRIESSNAAGSLNTIKLRLAAISTRLQAIETSTKYHISEFEKKYAPYIQEAHWISEDYIDDNLYYIDAETTLHKSAQPKVSYTINVVDLSQLAGYESYTFGLGDITYVQDPEFFGWVDGAPYKEKVVVTEITYDFDNPDKNSIKIQNYKDSFEDLFQRLNATTQQLKLHTGAYDRATDVVKPSGEIISEALEEAFGNNANKVANASNQSVVWDEHGITTTDTTNPAEVVRLTSGGLFITEDGGETWTTGITGSGINAKTVTTGQLNTEKITIASGKQPAFRWDPKGLNAYKEGKVVRQVTDENDETKDIEEIRRLKNTFVRFDQHGIYGIERNEDFDPAIPLEVKDKDGKVIDKLVGTEKIKEQAKFSLTWDGFSLNSTDRTEENDNTAKIRISDDNDIQILNKDNEELLRIGRLDGRNSVGMKVTTSNEGNQVMIGDTGYVDNPIGGNGHGKLVMRAGTKPDADNQEDAAEFRVYEDGFVYAKNAQIGGYMRPADLRNVKLEANYTNGQVTITCGSTIASDSLSDFKWSINTASINESGSKLVIGYQTLVDLNISITSDVIVKVSAKINNEEVAFTDSISIDTSLIYQILLQYATTTTSEQPQSGWQTDLPTLVPGTYLWTRQIKQLFSQKEFVIVGNVSVSYIGQNGEGGTPGTPGRFTSIVFCRTGSNTAPSKPSGGTYNNPKPNSGWSDGILPDQSGENPFVWSSQAVFDYDKHLNVSPTWSDPVLMMDVQDKFDVQYNDSISYTAGPDDDNAAAAGWYDPSELTNKKNPYWMATRTKNLGTGTWNGWVVTQIQGEKGDKGDTGATGDKGDKGDTGPQGPAGDPARDLNLKATSYVFTKKKDGSYSPSSITLTAVATNLDTLDGDKKYKWTVSGTEITNTGNTCILTPKSTSQTVKVEYGGFEEILTIYTIEEGKDGENSFTMFLTNPTMTFNSVNINATETTQAVVYYGNEQAIYSATIPTEGTSGLKYTLTESESNITSISNGVITVKNPNVNDILYVTITLYNNGIQIARQSLGIVCSIVENGKDGKDGTNGTSPYLIELTNDSASIGTTSIGSVGSADLQRLTTTAPIVYLGTTEITNSCTFEWEVTGGTLGTTTNPLERYLKTMVLNTATMVVKVTYNGNLIGSKMFTATKVKQGTAAVSYKLKVTPNAVNMDRWKIGDTIGFTVLKITGSASSEITSGYEIRLSDGETLLQPGSTYTIPADFTSETFELAINAQVWDKETVSAVKDGEKGDKGDKGDQGEQGEQGPQGEQGLQGPAGNDGEDGKDGKDGDKSEPIFIYLKTFNENPSVLGDNVAPDTTNVENSWTTFSVAPDSGCPYVFRSQGTKTTSAENNKITYGTWSEPELYRAYSDTGMNSVAYAEFLKLTNFGEDQGLFPDEDGNISINASFIKTGLFTVRDTDGSDVDIFSAGIDDSGNAVVTFGNGWTVNWQGFGIGTPMYGDNGIWFSPNPPINEEGKAYFIECRGDQGYFSIDTEGRITATKGTIAGWNIESEYLGTISENSLAKTSFIIAQTPQQLISGPNYNIYKNYYLNFFDKLTLDSNNNLEISGTVNADGGSIGGWFIQPSKISAPQYEYSDSNLGSTGLELLPFKGIPYHLVSSGSAGGYFGPAICFLGNWGGKDRELYLTADGICGKVYKSNSSKFAMVRWIDIIKQYVNDDDLT